MVFDMTAIFTWLFIFCNFSNFLMSAASSCEEKLPKLDDETMQATFGSSLYHSATMRGNIGAFHATGDTWTAMHLGEYFLTGIFQHYVHEISGLDMTFDYTKTSVHKVRELISKTLLVDSVDEELGRGIAGLLNKVAIDLKNNPIFVGLGICFHRNKVKIEKLSEKLRYIPNTEKGNVAKEAIFRMIMESDRLATDQQTAIYHWMKQTFENTINYIRSVYQERGELPRADDERLLELSVHEPEFLKWPGYRDLIPLALAEKS
jgi:hypothetical protein